MAILDFKEIAPAHVGDDRDAFELFAREFFQAKGFDVVEHPDRGADNGRDLIVVESRRGAIGTSEVRWLVSCKHKVHSGKSVTSKEEWNISDRVSSNGCHGFMAFYSTLPSSGVTAIVDGLRDVQYVQYDRERIERELLSDEPGRAVALRFMPRSFAAWRDLDGGVTGIDRHPAKPASVSTGAAAEPAEWTASKPERLHFAVQVRNHRARCAQIEVEEKLNQGSTVESFDVSPVLSFGTMEYDVKDLNVSVGLRRALCHVTSETGKVENERLGRGTPAPTGMTANAGDVWEMTSCGGGVLKGDVLGHHVLCRIRTPPGERGHARLELTASRSDIVCSFSSPGNVARATKRVMERFLENALFQKVSGHLLLSEVEMRSK
ncbi:hypothetical protein SAQ01S_25970 [Sphingomonas aquatilis NBRC 16722]|uniref:Restriction endonuclease type IV Mrr domain-containing protein n=1 Tax=Sphingomonas aquatilis TaxID=93063 RepID=A0AAW3TVP7_9SPHN|nr:restriction endonuclease [Sphingomonas aquatilis]MBB3876993.1 hypothetical protein [Sphingomonas aquatilis]GEM72831.1 hypothetical protein SAQ01S_25970 [Sphingomonas aquatilis NBRC 16722]